MKNIFCKTLKELKQYCRDNNIKGFTNKKKQEIIDIIKELHNKENIRVINEDNKNIKVVNKDNKNIKVVNKDNMNENIRVVNEDNKNIKVINKDNMNKKETTIKNKGTGAGGSNTNTNGIPYEEITELDDKITIIEKNKFSNIIKFNDNEKPFIKTKQANLFKYMEDEINKNIKKAHGCKNPDECYIDEEFKNIFIIEKKFQQCSGSVCEKIQTPDFKLWQYSRTFPDYSIIYIYCLSDWFKKNCIAELEYLDFKNIPYFWGNSETYKDDIINFILNYI